MLTHSLINLFKNQINSFINSSTHLFLHSFIHLFIHFFISSHSITLLSLGSDQHLISSNSNSGQFISLKIRGQSELFKILYQRHELIRKSFTAQRQINYSFINIKNSTNTFNAITNIVNVRLSKLYVDFSVKKSRLPIC